MSNNNEFDSMSPTVRAVYSALGGKAPTQAVQEAPVETTVNEQVDESVTDDVIVVDIFEENGEIVGLDNGVLTFDDNLPYIDIIEKYRGEQYIDELINEAVTTQKKPPAKKQPPAKKATISDLQPVKVKSKKVDPKTAKPIGPAKAPPKAPPKASAGASSTTNTKATPKKKTTPTPAQIRASDTTKPSPTAAKVAQRAKETKLDLGNMEKDIGDQLKATEKVVADKTKKDIESMKPGQVKQSFLSKITGGRLGKTTFTPGDGGTLGQFDKDFTQKISDEAKKIKQQREKDEAELGPVEIKSKKKPEVPVTKPAVEPPEAPETPDVGGADTGAADTPDTGAPDTGGTDTGAAPRTPSRKGAVPVRYSIDGRETEKETYRKKRSSGEVASQDVVFNVRNTKTGEKRAITKKDPEYQAYYSRYKKMSGAITEALIRMGAVLGEDGWYLNDELIESISTEYSPVPMPTPYYYDNTGRLKIMTEEEWTQLGLAEVILERIITEALDDVGEEDHDVDNDGDSDESDDYLKNRREKVAAAIGKGKK
jgi:hypothetical protein